VQRSRLPAGLLTPGTGETNRRAPTEVDTARLLARVARAFTAAQQQDGEIHLRLSPPELGSLRLQVQVHDGAVVARVETENSAAKTALLDNLPALRERLAEQGLRIDRFDVDLMQRQPGGMPDRPFNQQQDGTSLVRPARAVPLRAETTAADRPSLAPITAPGGLNVIV